MAKKKNGYITMKIPQGLAKKIDELVRKKKYTSRTSVIKRAIWNLYDEEIKGIYRFMSKKC